MTELDIIPTYMGYNTKELYNGKTVYFIDKCPRLNVENLDVDLKYHCSWDWLMPVCQKINNFIDYKYDVDNLEIINEILSLFTHEGLYYTEDDLKCSTNIDLVYKDVLLFIYWYNENH